MITHSQPTLSYRKRTLHIIWLALCGSVVMYSLVLAAIVYNQAPTPDSGALHILLTLLAAVQAGAAIWFRSQAVEPMSATRSISRLDSDPFAAFQTRCIVSWGLAESIAIFGMILGVRTHDLTAFLPLAAVSLLVMWITRPSS